MNKYEILHEVRRYYTNKEEKKFIPGKSLVPPTYPLIDYSDIVALVDVVLDGWFTEYMACNSFKGALWDVINKPMVQLCNSGSSASLLSISALSLMFPYKTHFITCATGFPTTVAPIHQNGKIPIFIDIDPYTLTPDLVQLEEVLDDYGDDVAGAIFTHMLGLPYKEPLICDMLYEIDLIADCCDALGAHYRDNSGQWVHVGDCATAMTLSFFPAHHITSAEGGAVLTDDETVAEIVTSLANWGRSCWCLPGQSNTCGRRFDWDGDIGDLPEGYDHKYIFDYLGYNLKMTELQGALGNSQMHRLGNFCLHRTTNYQILYDEFYNLPHIQLIPFALDTIPSPFGFPILVKEDAPFTANQFIAYLEEHKIGTRRLFAGNLIRQPAFKSRPYIAKPLPGSDYLMNNALWIGCHPSLTDEMLDYMIETVKGFFK